MITDKLRRIPFTMSAALLMAGLGCWLLATPRAGALVDTAHMLTGGGMMGTFETHFSSPGNPSLLGPDIPGPGLGESAVQMVMPAGTLSKLRVKLTTEFAPTIGTFTLMVRINGVDTQLTCQVAGTGQCNSGNKVKAINNNGLLAVRASNNFNDSGTVAYTYTMQFD